MEEYLQGGVRFLSGESGGHALLTPSPSSGMFKAVKTASLVLFLFSILS